MKHVALAASRSCGTIVRRLIDLRLTHPMKVIVKPVCALLIFLATPAWADLGRNEAAAVAQRVAGGRVLAVEKSEADRRPVWRVKLVTGQGEVRVILIDAASGRVVG